MINEALRPCPFCGGAVDMVFYDPEEQNEKVFDPSDEENGVVFPFIKCSNCDGEFIFNTPYGTGIGLKMMWNRRAGE